MACFFNSPPREKPFPHSQQTSCVARQAAERNNFPHCAHRLDRSAGWILWWDLSSLMLGLTSPHCLHVKMRLWLCVGSCLPSRRPSGILYSRISCVPRRTPIGFSSACLCESLNESGEVGFKGFIYWMNLRSTFHITAVIALRGGTRSLSEERGRGPSERRSRCPGGGGGGFLKDGGEDGTASSVACAVFAPTSP
ncbi:hypothetical protein EYF80_039649 [Liparis tanakae]|uniref:Uncharacterized protein n=1 Tax=Liparis tanakae TaxID=230148 RepID=A0A4Z2GAA8_9TELE|nr:hypothetical protein EYF80_039649 [Liparis tanakae]